MSPPGERIDLVVADDAPIERVDAYLARHIDESRSAVQRLVDEGHIEIDGRAVRKHSSRVHPGARILVTLPPPRTVELVAQNLPLDIVYQDDDVVVINKASGMVVHPAPGHPDGTLVNALLYHLDGLATIGGAMRPGIVHRIDKGTTGLMVVTKNDRTHQHLQALFAAHDIEREYMALCVRVRGEDPGDEGTFSTRHGRHPHDRKRYTGAEGARHAITHFQVQERWPNGAMRVHCTLETGRTHQIRMHLAEAGMPILADALYAKGAVADSRLIRRVALHARLLGFTLPSGKKLRFEIEPPADMLLAMDKLRAGASWRKG